jgi:hypothetical protein
MATMPSLIHGTSGALIRIRKTYVVKEAKTEKCKQLLFDQAHYMQRHGAPFARVDTIGERSYVMQRLRPLQHGTPLAGLLSHARDSLRPLWARPAVPASNWAVRLGQYIDALCRENGLDYLKPDLLSMLERVAYRPGTVGSTHGDATLDNALRNAYDELVWIDPIPYRENIPPLVGVDLGKLLQSAYGYERVKYGPTSYWCEPYGVEEWPVLQGMSEDDVFSARFFHRLAYLRGLRYFAPGPVLEHAYAVLGKRNKA